RVRLLEKQTDGTDKLVESMTERELLGWFEKNIDTEGNVTRDITLFAPSRIEVKQQKAGPVPWMLTDMTLDREQERVDPSGADLANFRLNPVLLWAHDHETPAIGTMADVTVEDGKLLGKANIDPAEVDPFAGMIKAKVERGTIRAGSIGFRPKKVEVVEDETDPTRLIYRAWELLEFSLCNVPMHPRALAQPAPASEEENSVLPITLVEGAYEAADPAKTISITGPEPDPPVKRVIAYADHGTAPEGAEWDGPAQVRAADVEVLKVICAWYDTESADTKGAYKLPHHLAASKKAVWRGVAAAMTALLGGRGGVAIPEGDRRGVYNHLAKHYKQFEKDPPEFKTIEETILERLERIEAKIHETEKDDAHDLLFGSPHDNTSPGDPSMSLLLGNTSRRAAAVNLLGEHKE
ncbi:MAG TPA: hypothetical protein VMZ92_16040, partial [Planctomycetota bacterium]|nr:hypothetical protein [Planctomycetota bacterium]